MSPPTPQQPKAVLTGCSFNLALTTLLSALSALQVQRCLHGSSDSLRRIAFPAALVSLGGVLVLYKHWQENSRVLQHWVGLEESAGLEEPWSLGLQLHLQSHGAFNSSSRQIPNLRCCELWG